MNNKLKKSIIAWTLSLVLSWEALWETKQNIDDCLNCSNSEESIKLWIDKFIGEFHKNKKQFNSQKDFWDFLVKLSKNTLPDFSKSFESLAEERIWYMIEYNKVSKHFFANSHIIVPHLHSILKISKFYNIESYIPELSCLFSNQEVLKSANIWEVESLWDVYYIWIAISNFWIVSIDSIKNFYDNYFSKLTSSSYENFLKMIVANEATHSILHSYYNFHNFSTKQPKNGVIITDSMKHELLSDAGSFCISWDYIALILWSALADIGLDEKKEPFFNTSKDSYKFTHDLLLDTLSQTQWFWEIKKIIMQQYNQYKKEWKKHLFHDKNRLERWKKILEILSEDDKELIRSTFINEWRKIIDKFGK